MLPLDPVSEDEHASTNDTEVILDVGGRQFVTSRFTLTMESPYFANLFSRRWSGSKKPDGSYFIDQDGE